MSIDFDYDRAAQLMNIMHQVSVVAPKASSIFGLAQRELNELNDKAKEIASEIAAQEEEERRAAAEEADKKRKADQAAYDAEQQKAEDARKVALKAQADAEYEAAKAKAPTPPLTTADEPTRRI